MWPDPQFPADLVTFTEEIFNGKLHFFVQCMCFFNTSSVHLKLNLVSPKTKFNKSAGWDFGGLAVPYKN